MLQLFLVKPCADGDLLRIRFAAQAAEESGLDHLRHIAFRIEVQFLAEHARGFNILDSIEQDERLQR